MLKLLCLKIQVMSSAADRAIRIVIVSHPTGLGKVLQLLLEATSNKIPILRKLAMEYFCLVASIWKAEAIEK